MGQIKKQINELGLSYKKEICKLLLIVLIAASVSAFLYLWKRQIFLLLMPLLTGIVASYLWFTSYDRALTKRRMELQEEFVRLFTYFSIFIDDGFNVYVSLQRINDFASNKMSPLLSDLLKEIDLDKTVTPFVSFASKFEDITIKEVMISIYQMIDEGSSGAYLTQFRHLFSRLSEQKYTQKRDKIIGRLDTLSFLPLAASGIAMIALVIALMDIMGGAFDVI